MTHDSATTNVLLSGVGGQGVILASYVLSQAAMAEGFDVKQSEVHGMSQRGGSVVSHLRFGARVASPIVSMGTADLLLSFEPLEALRYYNWLRPGGLLIYNAIKVNPSTVAAGLAAYPDDIDARISAAWPNSRKVDATSLAEQAGTAKAANMVLVGAISESPAVRRRDLARHHRQGRAAEDGRGQHEGVRVGTRRLIA